MAKIRFFELDGTALDWAVARAKGLDVDIRDGKPYIDEIHFEADGTPVFSGSFDEEYSAIYNPDELNDIINESKIGTHWVERSGQWYAQPPGSFLDAGRSSDPDRSLAILRVFVKMNMPRFTDDSLWVEVPDELLEPYATLDRQRG